MTPSDWSAAQHILTQMKSQQCLINFITTRSPLPFGVWGKFPILDLSETNKLSCFLSYLSRAAIMKLKRKRKTYPWLRSRFSGQITRGLLILQLPSDAQFVWFELAGIFFTTLWSITSFPSGRKFWGSVRILKRPGNRARVRIANL